MLQAQLAHRDVFGAGGGVLAGAAAENDDVQQRVAHEAVAAVDASHSLAGHIEVLHVGQALGVDLEAAVLIVEGGIDQDGLLADVDAVFAEHAHHGGNPLFNGALAVFQLDHGSIQPDAYPLGGLDALTPVGAFPDDGGGGDVAGL